MDLRWIASRSASCHHALEMLAADRAAPDSDLAGALRSIAEQVDRQCHKFAIPAERLYQHLVPLSAGIESRVELATIVLRKVVDPAAVAGWAGQFATLLTEAKAAYTALRPKLLDELQMRAGPLREQWEARGPGLLRGIARRTSDELIVERADVLLVEPVAGGAGAAHLLYNAVRIEAVLVNPHASLPEVVRLAWMLGQLNCDLPAFSESFPPGKARRLAGLAMLPPTLAAAADVELVGNDSPELLAAAIEHWRLGDATLAEPLASWWTTYTASRPAWHVALAALDQMVPEPE
ncbi:MAG TPA: hypothetical protein VG713_21590 [Pirellulales bacterium]|nr:hypothetical protein [Pirellulales bacterium]